MSRNSSFIFENLWYTFSKASQRPLSWKQATLFGTMGISDWIKYSSSKSSEHKQLFSQDHELWIIRKNYSRIWLEKIGHYKPVWHQKGNLYSLGQHYKTWVMDTKSLIATWVIWYACRYSSPFFSLLSQETILNTRKLKWEEVIGNVPRERTLN